MPSFFAFKKSWFSHDMAQIKHMEYCKEAEMLWEKIVTVKSQIYQ